MLTYDNISELVGKRVCNKHRMHLSDHWRYIGTITRVTDAIYPDIWVKFDGLEFESLMVLSDLKLMN